MEMEARSIAVDEKETPKRDIRVWEQFEKVRLKHFRDLCSGIASDKAGWKHFASIPKPIASYHLKCRDENRMQALDLLSVLQAVTLMATSQQEDKSLAANSTQLPEIPNLTLEEIFLARWGSVMLESSDKNKYQYDGSRFLKGIERRAPMPHASAEFLLVQDNQNVRAPMQKTSHRELLPGIHFRILYIELWDDGEEKVRVEPDGDKKQWRRAKAILIANAVCVHQLVYHLVYEHMYIEHVMASASQLLGPGHWIYDLLSPVSGDVGMINQVWGLKTITGLPEHAKYYPNPAATKDEFAIADILLCTRKGCHQMIQNAQRLLPESPWKVSWPILDGASKHAFHAIQTFVSAAVDHLHVECLSPDISSHELPKPKAEDDFTATERWLKQTFALDADSDTLKELLSNLLFRICVEHDRAHDDFTFEHADKLVSLFDSTKEIPMANRRVMSYTTIIADALNPPFKSSPETCWDEWAKEVGLQRAYSVFQIKLKEIVKVKNNINEFGGITH